MKHRAEASVVHERAGVYFKPFSQLPHEQTQQNTFIRETKIIRYGL